MAATEDRQSFSDSLVAWLRGDGPKTIGALNDAFPEQSFAVAIMLLMLLPALPLPTGGVTHVFELVTVVLGAEMVAGRRSIWLPARLRDRPLGSIATGRGIPLVARWVGRVERISRPRAAWLFGRRTVTRLIGLVVIAFAVAAALAPPFSGLDTLPAMGAVAVALSIVLRDVVVLAIGLVLGAAGIALILLVGAALVHLAGRLF